MASHCVAVPWRWQQLTKKLEADSRNPYISSGARGFAGAATVEMRPGVEMRTQL